MIGDIIGFVSNFLTYLRQYGAYKEFVNYHMTEEQREECKKSDAERGIKAHDRNRFDYAWNLTCIWWRHRDRYSNRCTGNCEECTLKNC